VLVASPNIVKQGPDRSLHIRPNLSKCNLDRFWGQGRIMQQDIKESRRTIRNHLYATYGVEQPGELVLDTMVADMIGRRGHSPDRLRVLCGEWVASAWSALEDQLSTVRVFDQREAAALVGQVVRLVCKSPAGVSSGEVGKVVAALSSGQDWVVVVEWCIAPNTPYHNHRAEILGKWFWEDGTELEDNSSVHK